MTSRWKSTLVAGLLLASAFFALLPVGATHALVGTARLGSVDRVPDPLSASTARTTESVIAGTSQVVSIDGSPASPPRVFAINFTGVTFSGAQFKLYMGTDGLAQVEGTDVPLGPLFSVSDFTNSTDSWRSFVTSIGLGLNGTFFIGSTKSGTPMVAGPIDMNISDAFGFIKIWDGFSASVATGSLATQPGIASITATPASGPPGAPVTVLGGGFQSGLTVDINASYTTHSWSGSIRSHDVFWLTGQSTGGGYFKTAATPMLDVKQGINPPSLSPFPTTPILLFAVDASHHSNILNSLQAGLGTPVFIEHNRGIAMVTSYSSTGTSVDTTSGKFRHGYLYGNDTGSSGVVGSVTVVDLPTINAVVFGRLHIAGNFSYAGATVTFLLGSTPAGATRLNTTAPVKADSKGFWNATVVVPILAAGTYRVWIEDNGVLSELASGVTGTVTSTTTTSTTTSTTTHTTSTTSTSTTSPSTTSTATSTTTTTTSSTHAPTTTVTSTVPSTTTSTVSSTTSTSSTVTLSSTSATSTSQGSGGVPDLGYIAVGAVALALVVAVAYLLVRGRRSP